MSALPPQPRRLSTVAGSAAPPEACDRRHQPRAGKLVAPFGPVPEHGCAGAPPATDVPAPEQPVGVRLDLDVLG